MAIHSSILAWEIPWTEEPGGLQPTGSQSQARLSTHAHRLSEPAGVSLQLMGDISPAWWKDAVCIGYVHRAWHRVEVPGCSAPSAPLWPRLPVRPFQAVQARFDSAAA